VLWASQSTRAAGVLSAQGGAHGGNGGRIETSGHVPPVPVMPGARTNGKPEDLKKEPPRDHPDANWQGSAAKTLGGAQKAWRHPKNSIASKSDAASFIMRPQQTSNKSPPSRASVL
jgi:hypothetical protein